MEKVKTVGIPVIRTIIRSELVTKEDLQEFKKELLIEIRALLSAHAVKPAKKWLKTYEVRKMLGISSGTLQTLRSNGTVPYSKIGGILYYDLEDIEKLVHDKKRLIHKYWKPDH